MSRWFVIGYRSNIILVRCKSIYNYVNIELLLYFFCFTTQDYVFFSPHRPTQTSAPTDADAIWRTLMRPK